MTACRTLRALADTKLLQYEIPLAWSSHPPPHAWARRSSSPPRTWRTGMIETSPRIRTARHHPRATARRQRPRAGQIAGWAWLRHQQTAATGIPRAGRGDPRPGSASRGGQRPRRVLQRRDCRRAPAGLSANADASASPPPPSVTAFGAQAAPHRDHLPKLLGRNVARWRCEKAAGRGASARPLPDGRCPIPLRQAAKEKISCDLASCLDTPFIDAIY